MRESVFLLAFGIAAATIVFVARAIANAIGGRRVSGDVGQLLTAIEDVQASLAQQANQLAELQERLDFTERLLAQGKDRAALPPGENPG
jgi:hypothetical protein